SRGDRDRIDLVEGRRIPDALRGDDRQVGIDDDRTAETVRAAEDELLLGRRNRAELRSAARYVHADVDRRTGTRIDHMNVVDLEGRVPEQVEPGEHVVQRIADRGGVVGANEVAQVATVIVGDRRAVRVASRAAAERVGRR